MAMQTLKHFTLRLLFTEAERSPKKAYIIEDDRGSAVPVQYVQTVHPNHTPQPVVLVDQDSVRSHPVGTVRSHKSSKRNFQL